VSTRVPAGAAAAAARAGWNGPGHRSWIPRRPPMRHDTGLTDGPWEGVRIVHADGSNAAGGVAAQQRQGRRNRAAHSRPRPTRGLMRRHCRNGATAGDRGEPVVDDGALGDELIGDIKVKKNTTNPHPHAAIAAIEGAVARCGSRRGRYVWLGGESATRVDVAAAPTVLQRPRQKLQRGPQAGRLAGAASDRHQRGTNTQGSAGGAQTL